MEKANKLLDAIEKNDMKKVELLLGLGPPINTEHAPLNHGCSVNVKGFVGNTPLHIAVSYQRTEIVELLLKNGAQVKVRNTQGQSPLHTACLPKYTGSKDNQPQIILDYAKLLLKHGADPNTADMHGHIPLQHVLENLQISSSVLCQEIIKVFLEYGADLNVKTSKGSSLLHLAVHYWPASINCCLLEGGADVDSRDTKGRTPIHAAAEHLKYDVLELLINKYDGNFDAQTIAGGTALHHLFSPENEYWGFSEYCKNHFIFDCAEMLLRSGADPNIADNCGRFPLQHVLQNKELSSALCQEIIPVFLMHGADVNVKTREGSSLLHLASRRYPASTNCYLIKAGADVNATDKYGMAPIHEAALNCNIKVMELLIKNGANVNAQTIEGDSPLNLLLSSKYRKMDRLRHAHIISGCAKILLENGGDPNLSNKDGDYPFQLLTEVDLIDMFLEYGFHISSNNKNGYSLHDVIEYYRKSTCDFLQKAGADGNVEKKKGETPSYIVSYNLGLIEKLLKEKSEINAETNKVLNPIELVITKWGRKKSLTMFANEYFFHEGDEILGFYYKSDCNSVYVSSTGLSNYIAMHVIKMRVANMSVNERLMNHIRRSSSLNKYYEKSYKNFHEKFISELNSLKDQFVSSTLTLYDVLTIDLDDLARRVKDEKVQQFMNSRSYYNSAPNYRPLLEYQFQKADRKRILLESCEQILFDITRLPSLAIQRIIHFLSNKDRLQLKNIYSKESDDEPTVT